MTDRDAVKNMTYTMTLVNKEKCTPFNYNIVFLNPFVAGTAKAVEIKDAVDENKGETKPQVIVNDLSGKAIYSYVSKDLALSDLAKNTYKLGDSSISSVTYAFDETNADWKKIEDNKSEGSVLAVDDNGTVTWKNQGAGLQGMYNLTVVATVTFKDLSVVKCNIPVKIIGK